MEGREGGRNGKTVLKFPLAATAAAAAAVRLGLSADFIAEATTTRTTAERASEERGLKGLAVWIR